MEFPRGARFTPPKRPAMSQPHRKRSPAHLGGPELDDMASAARKRKKSNFNQDGIGPSGYVGATRWAYSPAPPLFAGRRRNVGDRPRLRGGTRTEEPNERKRKYEVATYYRYLRSCLLHSIGSCRAVDSDCLWLAGLYRAIGAGDYVIASASKSNCYSSTP